MSRIFISEPDLVRIVCENRARRYGWALYTAILFMGLSGIVGFLSRVV